MKQLTSYNRVAGYLNKVFDLLNAEFFESEHPNFKDGRPKKYIPQQIQLALDLLEQGKTYRQITEMTGISKSTLIRARKAYGVAE